MTINEAHIALATRLLDAIDFPKVARIHLPPSAEHGGKDDDFGFVFLTDGSVGAFYTHLEDTLPRLRRRHTLPAPTALPELLAQRDLADRAVGIGLFNAIGAHLMRRARFQPPQATRSDGAHEPDAGETVGMVGYFCPLVEKLTRRGCRVVVLERQPERVTTGPGVSVATDPAVLADCRSIVCTGATLINDTLDELLAAAGPGKPFNLIGPTASLLPDALFEHGISATGGVFFPDAERLKEKLDAAESWGATGRKFQLTPSNYPGVDALLAAAT